MKTAITLIIALVLIALFAGWFLFLRGSGGLTRMVSITGIYAVCQPRGYDVVCFGDTAGHDGGVFCMPLAQASKDGRCK